MKKGQMGCRVSYDNQQKISRNIGREFDPMDEIYEVWKNALCTLDQDSMSEALDVQSHPPKAPKLKTKPDQVIKRTGWKTIRIFISSTFRDLHDEREVLVKHVFPQLRMWCQSRRLHVVDCDLRWGVPKDTKDQDTMRICLSEIDHCAEELDMPFFLGITSERAGWLVADTDVPVDIKQKYNWVDGLTITEMEIMHAAFRKGNPNALFMIRDSSFIEGIELKDEEKNLLLEEQEKSRYKVDFLKTMLGERFVNIKRYKCQLNGYNQITNRVEISGLRGSFATDVLEFFKDRIDKQFPLQEAITDPFLHCKQQHESFVHSHSTNLIGRQNLMDKINHYVCRHISDTPLVIVGQPGVGKTSVMTQITRMIIDMADKKEIQSPGRQNWHVFYHFVGAVPGSTDLHAMLNRFLVEMHIVNNETVPENLDQAALICADSLSNENSIPVIMIVDAVNQFDEESAAALMSWVPPKLAPHIRCILSVIPDTDQHKSMTTREPMPVIQTVKPLKMEDRKTLVQTVLKQSGKTLDKELMNLLLKKQSSDNPLWLSIACEELRLFGLFRLMTDKIDRLGDGLIELELQMLARFESENGGHLMVGTLCLLEASVRGLHENELRTMLADETNLLPPNTDTCEGIITSNEEQEERYPMLPALKWVLIYQAIGPYLRPFGESGEGRLDFYHRSLSKAVRRKYFQIENGETDTQIYLWWHTKLANYFEKSIILERKLEEYPKHLVILGDWQRLSEFLTGWDVVLAWVHDDYSYQLTHFWTTICKATRSTSEIIQERYDRKVEEALQDNSISKEQLELRLEKITRLFMQTGRFTRAKEILAIAKRYESELGCRSERMVELHHLTASIIEEQEKTKAFINSSQLGVEYHIMIESLEDAIALVKDLGAKYKYKHAVMLERLAFTCHNIVLREGDNYISQDDAQSKAEAAIEQSINIFLDLGMKIKVYDAMVTKGLILGYDNPQQLKCYKEAEGNLLRLVGEYNVTVARLYSNTAANYNHHDDADMAVTYFYKWYQVCLKVYGEHHPKIKKCLQTLTHPYYKTTVEKLNIILPNVES